MGHSASTIWESMQAKGYDRREFLRFCSNLSPAVAACIPEITRQVMDEILALCGAEA